MRTVLLLPLLPLLLTGCLATRNDVRRLEGELAAMRAAEQAAQAQQNQLLGQLREENARQQRAAIDTLRSVAVTLRGELSGQIRQLDRQVAQLRELTGQGQQRLAELGERLTARDTQSTNPAPPTTGGATAPAADPEELFGAAQSALQRGSLATARAGFEEYLRLAPSGPRAVDAQLGIADSYAQARDPVRALELYTRFVESNPRSPRLSTALYRSGLLELGRGNRARARQLFQQVSGSYPRSPEASLARAQLAQLR